MRSVRIQPIDGGAVLLVDIVCDCGHNCLTDVASGRASFKHEAALGGAEAQLACPECGKRHGIFPQETHIHVYTQ